MNKIILILGILSILLIVGCNQIDTKECKEFRCYYSSDTGGSLQIEYSNSEGYTTLGCPNKWLEMDLFYAECIER